MDTLSNFRNTIFPMYPIIIRLQLFLPPSKDESFICVRFYRLRSDLSVDSFVRRIHFDFAACIGFDFNLLSLFCRGKRMKSRTCLSKYIFFGSILRIYGLVSLSSNTLDKSSSIPDTQISLNQNFFPSPHIPLLDFNGTQFFENFPQFNNFIDSHPEIYSAVASSDINDIVSQLFQNPSRLNDIMRRHDQELRNIESLPGGFSALERLYTEIQEPLQSVFDGILPNIYLDRNQSDFSAIQNAENRRPLSNPWSSNMPQHNFSFNQHISQFPNQLHHSNQSASPILSQLLNRNSTNESLQNNLQLQQHNSSQNDNNSSDSYTTQMDTNYSNLTARFSSQLEILANMGFRDNGKNIQALLASNGDIKLALNFLLFK